MSDELPHALLRCPDCGTGFRVTLKKGRVPSRPIPCPKCKAPITVHETDVRGGRKAAVSRQVIPNDLRETKVASADHAAATMSAMAAAAAAPAATIDAPFADPPTRDVLVDPPTKDMLVREAAPALEPEDETGEDTVNDPGAPSAPSYGTPAQFGIVARKQIRPQGDGERGTATTLNAPGVQIVKGDKETTRDDVFAPREQLPSSSGRALGRLKLATSAPGGAAISADDPDLPAASSAAFEEPPSKPRISLDRLKLAMKRREEREAAASEASEASEGGEVEAAPGEALFEGAGAIELSEPSELMFDDISDVEDIDLDGGAPPDALPTQSPEPDEEPEPLAPAVDEPPTRQPEVDEPPAPQPEVEEPPRPTEPPRHTFPWSLLIAMIVFGVIGAIALFVATL